MSARVIRLLAHLPGATTSNANSTKSHAFTIALPPSTAIPSRNHPPAPSARVCESKCRAAGTGSEESHCRVSVSAALPVRVPRHCLIGSHRVYINIR